MTDPHKYLKFEESQLVRLAKAGDDLAFEALIIKRQSLVRNFMLHLCNDQTLADDLAQQVFLQAWRSIKKIKEVHAYGGWLKTIAVNVWRQYGRDHASKEQKIDAIEDLASVPEDSRHENHGESLDLDKCLQFVPEDIRLCIVLSFEWGMSHSEISSATSLPLGTVKSNIKRGLATLEQHLASYR